MGNNIDVQSSYLVEGVVSFLNKEQKEGAIKYDGKYYPFRPDGCIGGEAVFTALREGDKVSFPLTSEAKSRLGLVNNISPKAPVSKTTAQGVRDKVFELTYL